MTAVSIILRVISMCACGAAVYFWIDKQNLIAQKEAIIQDMELLVGYPTDLRKKGDEITQNYDQREANLAKLKQTNPEDASFTRLEEIRQQLVSIQGNEVSDYYGHKSKEILKYDFELPAEGEGGDDANKAEPAFNDPNAYLSFRGHIDSMTADVLQKIKTIESLNTKIEGLNDELSTQKTLLGQEIEKVAAKEKDIEELNAQITDKTNKYEQLQETYNQNQLAHQEKLEQLKQDLSKQKQELQIQVGQLKEINQDLELENRKLKQDNQQLARQNMQAGAAPGTSAIPPTPTSILGAPSPVAPPANPLTGAPSGDPAPSSSVPSGIFASDVAPINTQFIMFSPKTSQLALVGGKGSAIEKMEGKKLDLVANGKRLAALSIVKIDAQYTLFLVRQSKAAPEWQEISVMARGTPVTISAH